MSLNIIKQAIAQIRTQPMISIITIIGTALAIMLIMIGVILQEVEVAPFVPESNRNRFLHVDYMSIKNSEWSNDDSSNGPMSWQTARECFKSLKTPEAVTVYCTNVQQQPIQLPKRTAINVDVRETDNDYWKVFDFAFINGKPYDYADFKSGRQVAIISESVAKALFGNTDVVGKDVLLCHNTYSVTGVVKDVSTLASHAYGQVWIPFTSTNTINDTWCDDHMGSFSTTILAHSRNEFPEIRNEVNRVRDAYNKVIGQNGWELFYRNRPYDQEKASIGLAANIEPDVNAARRNRLMTYLILLIVPAINLSSMTQSRMRKRISEIGVRRSFGATRTSIVSQLIVENMIVTLIAGILGFLLSIVVAYIFRETLFTSLYCKTQNTPEINLSILIHASTFFMALLFCFILNLLSSGIPAWRAGRTNIVDAINNHGK